MGLGVRLNSAFADMIFTQENPIKHPDALKQPLAVMTHGKLLNAKKLEEMLENQKAVVRKIPTPALRPHLIHVDHKNRRDFMKRPARR